MRLRQRIAVLLAFNAVIFVLAGLLELRFYANHEERRFHSHAVHHDVPIRRPHKHRLLDVDKLHADLQQAAKQTKTTQPAITSQPDATPLATAVPIVTGKPLTATQPGKTATQSFEEQLEEGSLTVTSVRHAVDQSSRGFVATSAGASDHALSNAAVLLFCYNRCVSHSEHQKQSTAVTINPKLASHQSPGQLSHVVAIRWPNSACQYSPHTLCGCAALKLHIDNHPSMSVHARPDTVQSVRQA